MKKLFNFNKENRLVFQNPGEAPTPQPEAPKKGPAEAPKRVDVKGLRAEAERIKEVSKRDTDRARRANRQLRRTMRGLGKALRGVDKKLGLPSRKTDRLAESGARLKKSAEKARESVRSNEQMLANGEKVFRQLRNRMRAKGENILPKLEEAGQKILANESNPDRYRDYMSMMKIAMSQFNAWKNFMKNPNLAYRAGDIDKKIADVIKRYS